MIRLSGLTKFYAPGQTPAVDAIDAEFSGGAVTVVLGASGSGKTTLLKMLNRLLDPSRGSIYFNDQDIATVDPIELRRQIGYVIQSVGLFPHMTVAENVELVPELLGWTADERTHRRDEILQLVQLPSSEFGSRYPHELSGGQQQRVGVARALAAKPQVLLMDEPFGALDPVTRAHLQGEIKELQATLALTIVMVTHDVTEALLMADQIVVMKAGRIAATGTPTELFATDTPELADLFAPARRNAELLGRIGS